MPYSIPGKSIRPPDKNRSEVIVCPSCFRRFSKSKLRAGRQYCPYCNHPLTERNRDLSSGAASLIRSF